MKWVFTALIALNIIALSYFFLQKNENRTEAELNPERIEWVATASDPTAIVTSEPQTASTEEASGSLITAQESSDVQNEEKKICLASIEVDEKTYQALKPQLNKISHKTKRHEKAAVPQPEEKPLQLQSLTLYWVHIPVGSDDAATQLADLKSKGFDTHLMGNQISLGLFRNPAGAANLKQQAFNAGYTQTNITEKQGVEKKPESKKSEQEKIITYRLSFSPLVSTPAIEALLKKHPDLKVIACP